jgi:defect in organelle trafficking protein DotB
MSLDESYAPATEADTFRNKPPASPEAIINGAEHFARGYDGETFEVHGTLLREDFDRLLEWAAERKASDVTIQSDMPVIVEIGGKLFRATRRSLTAPNVEEIVRYVYGDNGPAELKRGFDLDPSHEIRVVTERNERGVAIDHKRLRFRVNATTIRLPGTDGIQMTIRSLPSRPIPIEKLELEQDILDNLRPTQGMIMVTGPTGSGKTTLLASIVAHLVSQPDAHEKVLEYSAPIEYVYDEIDKPSSVVAQSEVGRHLRPKGEGADDDQGSLFAYAVRNALRRKPTIIIIGESRDKATITASTEAALTGHLLYSTVHTMGVPETLRRMVIPFPAEEREGMAFDIMDSMRMIVTQTLVPRKGGGKVAAREYMIFDPATRAAFLGRPPEQWPQLARSMMQNRTAKSQKLVRAARTLLEKELITDETYERMITREI